jgi:hypothetical protein
LLGETKAARPQNVALFDHNAERMRG